MAPRAGRSNRRLQTGARGFTIRNGAADTAGQPDSDNGDPRAPDQRTAPGGQLAAA